ncbi:hypothetical protein CLOP_g14092 [Closterium sp. NIES-67]|nr:hypothetical protein CLOP_g14092 [Closterium sp. NIES-67]
MDHRPPSLAHPNKRIQLLPPSYAANGTLASTPNLYVDMESGMDILKVKGRVKSLNSIGHGSTGPVSNGTNASAATKTRNGAADGSRRLEESTKADGGKLKAFANAEDSKEADVDKGAAKKEKKKKLRCSFCDQTESNESTGALVVVDEKGVAFEVAGELTPTEICVHEDCLLWSPEVHFNKGRFMNVQKELRRSSGLFCTVCGGRGAALGCRVPACRHTYHVPCARQTPGCHFDDDAYVLSCPQHPPEGNKTRKLKRKQPSPPAPPPRAEDSDDEEEAEDAQDARRGKAGIPPPPVVGKNQRRARTGAGGRAGGAGGRKASAQRSTPVPPKVPVTKDVIMKDRLEETARAGEAPVAKNASLKEGAAAERGTKEDAPRVDKGVVPVAKVPVTKDVPMRGDVPVEKTVAEGVTRVRKEGKSLENGLSPELPSDKVSVKAPASAAAAAAVNGAGGGAGGSPTSAAPFPADVGASASAASAASAIAAGSGVAGAAGAAGAVTVASATDADNVSSAPEAVSASLVQDGEKGATKESDTKETATKGGFVEGRSVKNGEEKKGEDEVKQEERGGMSLGALNAMAPCSSTALASASAQPKPCIQAHATNADSEAVFKVPQPVVMTKQLGAGDGPDGGKGEGRMEKGRMEMWKGGCSSREEVRREENVVEEVRVRGGGSVKKDERGREEEREEERGEKEERVVSAVGEATEGDGALKTGADRFCSRSSGKPPSGFYAAQRLIQHPSPAWLSLLTPLAHS